jgi:chemotaxis family two-component system response regulator Rcp1
VDPEGTARKACVVLLVEDNLADAGLLRWALADTQVRFEITVVRDSEAAFEHLRAQAAAPDLVLLDLNLPGRDGREILQEIRASTRFGTIPVIVLTSSQASGDVRTCLEMRADHYLTKPLDLVGYEAIARSIERYWLSVTEGGKPADSAGSNPPRI